MPVVEGDEAGWFRRCVCCCAISIAYGHICRPLLLCVAPSGLLPHLFTLYAPSPLYPFRGNGKLEVVESKEVKGAVYAMQPFQGKLLATVNSKVHVFKWVPAGGGGGSGAAELVSETSTPVQVLSLFLAAR